MKIFLVVVLLGLLLFASQTQQYGFMGIYPLSIFKHPKIKSNDEIYRDLRIRHKMAEEIRRLEQERKNSMKQVLEAKQKSMLKSYHVPLLGRSRVDFSNRF